MMNTLRYTQLTQRQNAVAENTSNLLLIHGTVTYCFLHS